MVFCRKKGGAEIPEVQDKFFPAAGELFERFFCFFRYPPHGDTFFAAVNNKLPRFHQKNAGLLGKTSD